MSNPLPLAVQIGDTAKATGEVLTMLLDRAGVTFNEWVELRQLAGLPESDDPRLDLARRLVADVNEETARSTDGLDPEDLETARRVLALMAERSRSRTREARRK